MPSRAAKPASSDARRRLAVIGNPRSRGFPENDSPSQLARWPCSPSGPGFAPCGTLCLGFELQHGSLPVDAGTDEPFGDLSATDLAGKSRIISPHVDIGAYENDGCS